MIADVTVLGMSSFIKNNNFYVITMRRCKMNCGQVFTVNSRVRTEQYFKKFMLLYNSLADGTVENAVARGT